MSLHSSLLALLLTSLLARAAARQCPSWTVQGACWKSSPSIAPMKPRTGGTLPKFEIDTAFHTLDKEAGTKWVATIPAAAGSFADHLKDHVIDAAKDKVVDMLPFSSVFKIGLGILGAVGIDMYHDSQQQPIKVDMTNLFNRLEKNVLDQVDQRDFQDHLNNLQAAYTTYSEELQNVQDDANYASKLRKLATILGSMDEKRNNDIQVQEYADKYAFYMLEPLVAHASAHYTAVLLRAAAQLNLYMQDPKGNVGLNKDVCTDLLDFSRTAVDAYKTWYNKYWAKAYAARINKVPTKPSCGGKCDAYCTGGTMFPRCYETKNLDYTWKDSWPLLQMQDHKEGWGCGPPGCGGVITDGSGFSSEVNTYVKDMKAQLGKWGDNLHATVQSLADGVKLLTDACSSGSLTLV